MNPEFKIGSSNWGQPTNLKVVKGSHTLNVICKEASE